MTKKRQSMVKFLNLNWEAVSEEGHRNWAQIFSVG